MCYQINKATKDANREIRAAHLASVGRKRNETFPSRLCSMFSLLKARQICMFLFEDLRLKGFIRNRGSPGSGGIYNAFSFLNSLIIVGLASHQVCSFRRGWKQGKHQSQNEGFIPAANIHSAPEWRLV